MAISTELPVALALVGAPVAEIMPSPFLIAAQAAGSEATQAVVAAVEQLRSLREKVFPIARRAAGFWAEGDEEAFRAAVEAAYPDDHFDWSEDSVAVVLDDLLERLLEPIELPGLRMQCAEELLAIAAAAMRADPESVRVVLAHYAAGPLREHRRRFVQAFFAALDDVQAVRRRSAAHASSRASREGVQARGVAR